MKKFFFGIILLISAIVFSGCDFSLAQDITPPPDYETPVYEEQADSASYPLAIPDPSRGEGIYQESCMPCHGESGLGDGSQAGQLAVSVPAISAAESSFQASPLEWFDVITQGDMQNYMPSFANIYSDQERWDVLAYIYSLAAAPELLEQGEEVYGRICADCHAPDGSGGEQARDFTDQQGMAGLSGAGILQVLSSAAAPHDFELTAEEAWAAAAYIRSFNFPVLDSEAGAIAPLGEAVQTMEAGASESNIDEEGVATAAAESTPTAEAEMDEHTGLTIRGAVTNGSGVEMEPDFTLTLYGYDNFEPAVELTGKTAADGSFEFSGLDSEEGRLFFITLEHQGAVFASEFATLQAGQTEIDLPVVVYEVTHDASVLKAESLDVFFEFNNPETVQVIQLWVISNPSNRAVAPLSRSEPVLLISLPEGYSNLVFESGQLGQQYLETESGFGNLLTVLPGEGVYQLLYAFQLPYQRGLEYVQTVSPETDLLQVYVPEGIKVTAEGLSQGGLQDLNGLPYYSFKGSQLAAGSDLYLSLKGRNPSAGSLFSFVSDRANLLIGAGGLLMVVAGVVLWLRQSRKIEDRASFGSAEDIMDEIIDLDEAYEAGEIGEDQYREQRAELKSLLADSVNKVNDPDERTST